MSQYLPPLDDVDPLPPLGSRIKALMVWPRFAPSFWTFQGSMSIFGKRAMLPPLGLITVAALCPRDWSVRLIDETVEELQDSDILWADLVMVSGLVAQRAGVRDVLQRARRLGVRTIVGGPFASTHPGELLPLADHVVMGEPDEVFDRIASDLEEGTARKLYEILEKPDITKTPVPRYDLLQADAYVGMSLQFSRGCPFQCEFCDIITIYGRKPRTKTPDQVLAELEAILELGRGKLILVVDDNFIGNRKRAVELLDAMTSWQERHRYPFAFMTEASINLAQCPDLLEGMATSNFETVFIGIESPSAESLTETKKLQNLRQDLHTSIATIQSHGMWVTGGFIVGFDSDPDDIFDQQVRFITDASIPFAMIGMLQAPPTTPLYDRMVREGRLQEDLEKLDISELPNFRTRMPRLQLARGYRRTVKELYEPGAYLERGFASLHKMRVNPRQKPADARTHELAVVIRSLWFQGVRSSYRRAYWTYVGRLLRHFVREPVKLGLGFMIVTAGHHFISFAAEVVAKMDEEIARLEREELAAEPLTAV